MVGILNSILWQTIHWIVYITSTQVRKPIIIYIYKREVFCIEDEYIPLKQYEDQPDPDDSEDVEHSSEDDDGASGVILAEEDGGDYVQPSDTCPMVI